MGGGDDELPDEDDEVPKDDKKEGLDDLDKEEVKEEEGK